MHYLVYHAMRLTSGLSSEGWTLVLAGLIVVAVLCMRGYGSRSSY